MEVTCVTSESKGNLARYHSIPSPTPVGHPFLPLSSFSLLFLLSFLFPTFPPLPSFPEVLSSQSSLSFQGLPPTPLFLPLSLLPPLVLPSPDPVQEGGTRHDTQDLVPERWLERREKTKRSPWQLSLTHTSTWNLGELSSGYGHCLGRAPPAPSWI